VSERGYRGYVGSRPVRGVAYPQRVQNLVVRDYAQRRGLAYRLSLVEHAMPGSYMILEDLLDELPRLDGVIFFSAFMLPPDPAARRAVYDRVIAAGATLHAALENRCVSDRRTCAELEETILVANVLGATPFGGRYEKDGRPPAIRSATDAALLNIVNA
jgi:sporadic carbohydrate cluster protein (TIGR04323 family)